MKEITFTVTMTESEAEALAQFLKRAGLSAYSDYARTGGEMYQMLHAGEKVRAALADVGFAPR